MSRSVDDCVLDVMRRIGVCLRIPIDFSALDLADVSAAARAEDRLNLLVAGARRAGVYLKEAQLDRYQIESLLLEGMPVIAANEDGSYWVFEKKVGRRIEASYISDDLQFSLVPRRQMRAILQAQPRLLVAKLELECSSLSRPTSTHHASAGHIAGGHGSNNSTGGHGGHGGHGDHGDHGDHGGHEHVRPLRRFMALLQLDQRDVWMIGLFALVAGILALATPLAVESLVNVVSWGTYVQPLLVLAFMLLACLGLAGVLRILQTIVVEMVQRRQLVRIVGDLSHRFPRAHQVSMAGEYSRELANRVFDIMTIQKASAVLLLDGFNIVLTTVLGMLLLAFYHPFLLGFAIALLLSMISLTWVLGRGGISTAIDESLTKYEIAHWLQDVLAGPVPFKVNGGERLAVERANRLTTDYLEARQRQFRVVIRQVTFAIGLQVIASTVLLGLGGWLVISQQLTLGQLVASELVVTLVVSTFSKAGKTLEQFYDLMAGVDKVGHLLDIPVDARYESGELPAAPVEVRWEELQLRFPLSGVHCHIPSTRVPAGSSLAVMGPPGSGKSALLKILAGLQQPDQGMAEIAGMAAQHAAFIGQGDLVAFAGEAQIFHAPLIENVDLSRSHVGQRRVREALVQVGLWDDILHLPQGLNTFLQTDGRLLSSTQRAQLGLAQAIAGQPKLLLLDGLLDQFPPALLEHVWQALTAPEAPWTLIVVTHHDAVASRCDMRLNLDIGHEPTSQEHA